MANIENNYGPGSDAWNNFWDTEQVTERDYDALRQPLPPTPQYVGELALVGATAA